MWGDDECTAEDIGGNLGGECRCSRCAPKGDGIGDTVCPDCGGQPDDPREPCKVTISPSDGYPRRLQGEALWLRRVPMKTIRVQAAWGGPEYEVSLDDIAMVSINPADPVPSCDYEAQFWLKSYSTPIALEKPEGLRLRAAWLEHLK